MNQLVFSTQFKKDLKRLLKYPDKIKAINDVLEMLRYDVAIPYTMKPHRLKGNYVGCFECHVQNDLLLIWIDRRKKTIYLERVGTHSELYE